MITLLTVIGFLVGKSDFQKTPAAKPQTIQMQEKVYALTKPIELAGDGSVIDGHNATLTGKGTIAIQVAAASHVTIKNLNISGFATGVLAQGSTDLSLINVTVSNCGSGVRLEKVAGGLVQGLQVHGCAKGVQLNGCSKLIFEKSDLSKNSSIGLDIVASSSCIFRDNKVNGIGDGASPNKGVGISVTAGSNHNQMLRNVVAHCGALGIKLSSVGNSPSTDNTFDGNDVSWTIDGIGMVVSNEADNKVLDSTAGFCRAGMMLTGTSNTLLKGNLMVGNRDVGIEDEGGTKNVYDTNVFVQENGGPLALWIKSAVGVKTDTRVFKNVFEDYARPIRVENASPLSFQSNSFPGAKSAAIEDLAEIIGKKPLALDMQRERPDESPFVPSVNMVAAVPTIYDRVGGVSMSSTRPGDFDIVVEGSLSGFFQGEEEVIARYKGELPVDILFPPKFEAQIRVRAIAEKPIFLAFLALLGDNSMAKHQPADDSGDTLFSPGFAVSGDISSPDNVWKPPKGKAGDWWDVDMKFEETIDAISVMAPPAHPDDFWSKFHVSVSSTGLFKGEETVVFTETNFSQKLGPIRVYRFPPVSGRYVRITGDVDQQGVQLQQFGVYGIKH